MYKIFEIFKLRLENNQTSLVLLNPVLIWKSFKENEFLFKITFLKEIFR